MAIPPTSEGKALAKALRKTAKMALRLFAKYRSEWTFAFGKSKQLSAFFHYSTRTLAMPWRIVYVEQTKGQGTGRHSVKETVLFYVAETLAISPGFFTHAEWVKRIGAPKMLARAKNVPCQYITKCPGAWNGTCSSKAEYERHVRVAKFERMVCQVCGSKVETRENPDYVDTDRMSVVCHLRKSVVAI
jgi:hypothetical protein